MDLSPFDFELPDERIARQAWEPRDESRLMVLEGDRPPSHHRFKDLPRWLRPGDLLVANHSKVIPARLQPRGEDDRSFEVLLLSPLGETTRWRCLVRPGRKVADEGTWVHWTDGTRARLTRENEGFVVAWPQLEPERFLPWLDTQGEPPLPPYFKRAATTEDRARYQTVFAREGTSVAAPTAGLHFTPQLLARLGEQGVGFASLRLDVGYGTFAPLTETQWESGQLHEELYEIPEGVQAQVEETRSRGGRVIAVGTTSLRALESWGETGKPRGTTRLFIRPGYRFQRVQGLITNFHLPQSSLLMLVAAFGGRERVLAAYREAVAQGYRFYSYGDAMVLLP